MRGGRLLSFLILVLSCGSPALAAQAPVGGRPLARRVAAIRLHAMVAAPGLEGALMTPALVPPALLTSLPRHLRGRSIRLALLPDLDLRGGLHWWPAGPRASVALRWFPGPGVTPLSARP